MKFRSIEIENVLAYKGTWTIDLSDTDGDRNIVLIKGRNGAGKTSLLNSMKLLFLGARDEGLKRVGFASTTVSEKHYVLGQPGLWYGVFNRSARAAGDTRASISLTWFEGSETHRARRIFQANKNFTAYEEMVEFGPIGAPLHGAEAEAALQQMMPREVVPFFLFDGEQVQSLADAEIGRERSEIERLLGLSFVVHLIQQVDEDAKRRSRAGLPAEVMVQVVAAENAARESRVNQEVSARARVAAEEELMDLEQKRSRLDDERQRLRNGTLSESEAKRMASRLELLAFQRQRLADELAERIPVEIVFRTQPALVAEAFETLDRQATADASLAGRLHSELPALTVAELARIANPVVLTSEQERDLGQGIRSSLKSLGVSLGDRKSVLSSLSANKAKSLRDRFLVWSTRGPTDFAEDRAVLMRLRETVIETQRLRKELDEAELSTDEARARYQELTEEIEGLRNAIREATEKSAEARVDEQRHAREALAHDERAEQAMERHKDAMLNDAGYKLALKAKRALETYRERSRSRIRQSVEDRLNEKVGILLAPSELIKTVALDEQFIMTYFDERGDEVPRLSISAGMRQLLAMSMLWALKEEADRSLPVVIDTPLGRIDTRNRTLLMTQYFPKAGSPLILLPTDSEFTDLGDELLGDRIKRRYRIDNTGGQNATIVREAP